MTEKEEKDILLIEQYIQGQLSTNESKAFENRIESEADFAKLYEEISGLIGDIKAVSSNESLAFLQKLEQEHFNNEVKVRSINSKTYWLAVASVILIIVISVFVFRTENSTLNKQLFVTAFEAPANYVSPTVRGEEKPQEIRRLAYYYYDLAEYEQALNLFLQIPEHDDNGLTLFYIGNTYLALEESDESIMYLKKYLANYNDLEEDANWYLFLAYVLNEDLQNATNLYEQSAENSKYRGEMELILKQWIEK